MTRLRHRPGSGRRSPKAPGSARRRTAVPWLERLESRDLPRFFSPLDFAADYNAYAVAEGDLNGDGKPDLARADAAALGTVKLPQRWVVERTFAWLGRSRRLSKDYERVPESSEAMI
jgi:transposase